MADDVLDQAVGVQVRLGGGVDLLQGNDLELREKYVYLWLFRSQWRKCFHAHRQVDAG